MTQPELLAVIFDCLARIAPEADPASLPLTDNLRESLDIDSFDFLQFLIALSQKVGLEVPEADYAQFDTLEHMTAYLTAHLPSRLPHP